jgi:plastocyanin
MALRLLATLLLLSALALAGCSSGEHDDPEVDIHGNTFDPASLTIAAGEHVHFNNHDGVAHTATSDTGAFDTGNIAGGASGSAQFDQAGTFPYHCKIHPSMKGTIVVR